MIDLIQFVAQVTPVVPVDAGTGVSGINWNTVILGILSVVGTAVSGVIAIFVAKTNANALQAAKSADDAAVKVAAVRDDLKETTAATAESLGGLTKVAKDTHTLVNSQMGIQLLLGRDLSEFKAQTTKLPEDIAAATLARSRYDEHVKKQAKVDSGVDQGADKH